MASAADDTQEEKAHWHWRNSMRPVRFFNLDARAALPFCVLLVYFRPVTLFVTFLVTTLFWWLERRGLTFPAALRALRLWLIGNNRQSWALLRRRELKDLG